MNYFLFFVVAIVVLPVFFNVIVFLWRFLGLPNFKKTVFFKDSYNRIQIYRGVNVCNSSKSAPDFLPWHTEEDYAKLKKWGFNLVRFLVYWEAIEPEKGKYNLEYVEKVKEHIAILNKLGIDVIIDLHQDLYSRKFTGNGFPNWALPPKEYSFKNQTKWWLNYFQPYVIECYRYFWSNDNLKNSYLQYIGFVHDKIACPFSNVIGIDVFNEPFPNFPFIWNFEKKVLNSFYNTLAILANISFKRFFFESWIVTSAGLPTSLNKSLFKKACHIPHYYPPFSHNEGNYNRVNSLLAKIALRSKALEARRFANPCLIGEFGISPQVINSEQFIVDFLNASEKYHINWLWYCYDKDIHSSHGIVDENRNQKSFLSKLIRVYPQKIAGSNPKYYTENNVFFLEYNYDLSVSGSTEIFLPSENKYEIVTTVEYTIENNILKINLTKSEKIKIEIRIL